MRPVKIFTDTTADLSYNLCSKYGITEIPLYINISGEAKRDMLEVTPEDVLEAYAKNKTTPKTSAIPIGDFESYLLPWEKKGYDVIYLSISSDFSSCYQHACAVASGHENIYIIDSRNLSAGIGYLAIKASEMAAEGFTGAQIRDEIESLKERVDVAFIVGNIEFLHKGGRCSSVAALGANLLSIKPVIEVVNGKMRVGKKYRGKLDKCIEMFIKDKTSDKEHIDASRMMYATLGCSKDTIKSSEKLLKKCIPFDEMLYTDIGTTIASHVGPEVFGFLTVRKEEK